jgi:hypothetical protein
VSVIPERRAQNAMNGFYIQRPGRNKEIPSVELRFRIAEQIRSAQSQARDEALEEAAASLDSYSSPTDVGEEMAHMFARRVRALKASKP